jgi:acetyl esterase
MTPQRAREVFRQRALLFEGDKLDAGTVWDTTIPAAHGPIPARAYRPMGGRPRPIFVYLHGGGWTLGDLDSHDHLCRRIAVAADCMVVSVA